MLKEKMDIVHAVSKDLVIFTQYSLTTVFCCFFLYFFR